MKMNLRLYWNKFVICESKIIKWQNQQQAQRKLTSENANKVKQRNPLTNTIGNQEPMLDKEDKLW